MGSGSLSFKFSGDTTGTFSVSGALISNQSTRSACGALFVNVEDELTGLMKEEFSLLALRPTGNGKADIFLLGSRLDSPIKKIEPGNYVIGPFGFFVGVYFVGIDIEAFWAGEVNLKEVSEMTFEIAYGMLEITSRDNMDITGAFSGTSDTNREASKFLLK